MKGGPQTWDDLEEPVSVRSACISLDGTRIAAVFADKTLCIYDTITGEAILSPFKVDEYPRSVIFSQDGKLVASGGQALRLWNVETGQMVESFDINVYSLAFSPDGTCIAAGCEGAGIIPYSDTIEGWDKDGSFNIRVIDLELAKMPQHSQFFMLAPFSRRRIMRLNGEVLSSPFEGHRNQVNFVAYSPDGEQIASSSDGQTVRVWDISTGRRRTFQLQSSRIHSAAFSPDGTQLVSVTGLINLSTGSFTPHAFGDTEQAVLSFAFSVDGRFFASAFCAACQIWDSKTHQIIVQLVGHTDDVTSLAFFPDAKQIISASKDGTIRVWNIELLKEREDMDGWRIDRGEDGRWILGPEKEHIFWTPLPIRHTRNTFIIGRCLEIDFTNFVHGDEWWKCGEPLQRTEK